MTTDDALSMPHERLAALVVALSEDAIAKDERIAALEGEKAELQLKLQQTRQALFGPSSERTVHENAPSTATTLLGIPADSEQPPAASTQLPETETETVTYQRKKRAPGATGHGRTPVSREIRVVEVIIPATAAERIGPGGETLVFRDYEVTERIDLDPHQLIRLVYKRERLGLPDTRETVFTAALPDCLTPKGKATDRFIHEILVRKFLLGLPLYRQAMDLNLQGAQINDAWMGDCVRAAATFYSPVALAIRDQVLANRYVQADETPILQQTDTGIRTGYFWVWLGGGQVHFHYGTGRSQDEVNAVLGITDDGTWERGALIGYLLCDGYAGYNPAFASGRVIRVACWAHVRRKFYALRKTDRNAAALLALIDQLFRIERTLTLDIEQKKLNEPAGYALRVERRIAQARPLLTTIKETLERLAPLYTDKSAMRLAINYALTLWESLIVYVEVGELPLDNNGAERAIRPIAVGRKAFLFVGSEDGGDWAATFYSIMESCRLQRINPRRYLAYVTPLLVGKNPPIAASLTPKALQTRLTRDWIPKRDEPKGPLAKD